MENKTIKYLKLSLSDLSYYYHAKVLSVYDGDTITVVLDLGLHINFTVNLRLLGVDTPEIKGKDRVRGLEVRDYVREKTLNKNVLIKTHKQGKYGRYLATVYYLDKDTWINLNVKLIEKKYAREYWGGKR